MSNPLCRAARKHFSDAIDGQPLSPLTRFYVGMHRTVCPLCIRYEKSLRGTMAAGQGLRDLIDEEAGEPPRGGGEPGGAGR